MDEAETKLTSFYFFVTELARKMNECLDAWKQPRLIRVFKGKIYAAVQRTTADDILQNHFYKILRKSLMAGFLGMPHSTESHNAVEDFVALGVGNGIG